MILVTGGTGLVGSHLLLKLLEDGKKVMAIKRESSNLDQVKRVFSYYTSIAEDLFQRIEWADIDVTSLPSVMEICSGMEEVYHCAAFISFHGSDKRKMLYNNITGASNIVDACLAADVKKLCYVSSVAALGEPVQNEEIDEKTLWKSGKGRSAYAVSKFKSEMEVWRGTCEGLKAVIVNPSVILGPGKWNSGSASIVQNVYKGLKFYPPGKTGFVDVRDVVQAMIMIMNSDISNERFVLNAENLRYKEVFEKIALHLNKPAPAIGVTPFMASLAWRGAWIASKFTGNKPSITKETVEAGFNYKAYSNQKIKDKLGYSFRSIDETIKFITGLYLKEHSI